ncbi:MAG: T9SS type A sorting domain-containing protein [Lutibacter sp.]
MRKNYVLLFFFIGFLFSGYSQNVFINEIHYDNASTDTGEGIEIAGPAGTDLSGYSVVFYNGNGGASYATLNLSGIIPNQQNSIGTIWFDQAGIQNGAPDGFALVDSDGTSVIQFLSYEGSFTAVGGVANGMTSTDIGVSESGTTPVGQSLQLIGTGSVYTDFTWSGPTTATKGLENSGQTLPVTKNEIANFSVYPNPVVSGKFTISSKNNEEKLIEVYTMTGKQVYKNKVKNNEVIDVSMLTRGIYLLKVQKDSKVSTRKLVVN